MPKVINPFQPNAPTCTCATIQSVKCAMAFTCFSDSKGPSKVAIPYAVNATTINFNVGSVRTLSQAPRKVNNPLIIPPQLGAINIIENTTPSDWTQDGSEV